MPYLPLTEDTAREIVLTRMTELTYKDQLSTLKEFAKELYQVGSTPHIYSVSTLYKVLSGQMYPDLKDREGKPFKWDDVPRRQRGPGRTRSRSIREELQHHKARIDFLYRRLGINPEAS